MCPDELVSGDESHVHGGGRARLTKPQRCQLVPISTNIITAHTPATGGTVGQAGGENPAGVGIQHVLGESVEQATPTTGRQSVAVERESANSPGLLVDVIDTALVLTGHKARETN